MPPALDSDAVTLPLFTAFEFVLKSKFLENPAIPPARLPPVPTLPSFTASAPLCNSNSPLPFGSPSAIYFIIFKFIGASCIVSSSLYS
jgi:hypothetical protein